MSDESEKKESNACNMQVETGIENEVVGTDLPLTFKVIFLFIFFFILFLNKLFTDNYCNKKRKLFFKTYIRQVYHKRNTQK